MTIFRHIILFSLILGLFLSCDHCEKTTKTWKNDAVIAVVDLKEATKEISDHSGIFNYLKFNGSDLYLDSNVLDGISQENKNVIPKLLRWFQKTSDKKGGRSYISFKGETITAGFKSCIDKSISYDAYLYYSKSGIRPGFTKNWKREAELKDSLDLGDNWYYILARCDGCRD